MLAIRTVPVLLLDGAGLVKGNKFANHKYVGDPINAVKIFNEKEVDEIVFLDISARKRGEGPNFKLIQDIASEAFMPFAYGGMLDNVADIERMFRIGAEKAVLNTSFIDQPDLVREASKMAGSQSIVVSIDVKKTLLGKYHVHTHSGQNNRKLDPIETARMAQDLGAGEIIITSIDREGTGSGYDLDLIENIANVVDLPVVASGGAAGLEDFANAVRHGASAVSAGDMFTFRGKYKAVLITYPSYSDLLETYRKASNV